jgi:3-hydroxybutyryl-CoA dehydrogenase
MRVAVIGAGLMGHGIALVWAMGGHTVRLTDSSAESLARSQGLMEKALGTLEAAGEAYGFTVAQLAQSVTRHATLAEAVDGAELVIEAIVENPTPSAPCSHSSPSMRRTARPSPATPPTSTCSR